VAELGGAMGLDDGVGAVLDDVANGAVAVVDAVLEGGLGDSEGEIKKNKMKSFFWFFDLS
jgi:hypothetical protein